MMTAARPRRYSLFSGSLLILIGVLFLVHNLKPGLIELGQLLRYWPVLLILLGIAKLLDRLLAHRADQAPPRVLTGGELFLLILVIGGAAAAIGFTTLERRHPDLQVSWGLWGHPYTFSQELPPQELKPGSTVGVSTPRGDISARPGQDSGLRVVVTKTVTGSNWDRASALAGKIRVNVEATSQGYEVSPQLVPGTHDVRVSLETYLPAQTSLSASTDSGDVRVEGLTGTVSVTTGRGDIEAHKVSGDVSARIAHGDARITGVSGNVHLTGRGDAIELDDIKGTVVVEGEFFGPIRIYDVNRAVRYNSNRTDLTIGRLPGRLEMDSGSLTISDTPGSIHLTTRDRDIELENVTGQIEIENHNGKIAVRFRQPPREDVSITNKSGDVELALPAGTTAQIFATSRSGNVESDFESLALRRTEQGNSHQLEGSLGTGGPKISITTTYGTVHLEKTD